MRVEILGRRRLEDQFEWQRSGIAEAFGDACSHIGRELVGRAHSLIIGVDTLHTAGGNVVLRTTGAPAAVKQEV